MKKAKKILTLVACAVLLVCISVGATIAYLTSNTQVVTNTFTVGNVEITLDEAPIKDGYGEADTTADRITTGNEYKLIPNHTYDKDPIVHVQKGSEQCYVFVKVVNGIKNIEAAREQDTKDDEGNVVAEGYKTIADQMAANGWTELVVDGKKVEGVFYYSGDLATNAVVDARTAQKNLVVFEEFKIASGADVSGYVTATNAAATITIDAYAIQADGFADAVAAWKANEVDWANGNTTDDTTGDDETAGA